MLHRQSAALLLATSLYLVAGIGQADGNERDSSDSSNQCPAVFPTWLLGSWHRVESEVTDYGRPFEERVCWGMARFAYYSGDTFYFDYDDSLGWHLIVEETAPCRIIEIVEVDSRSVRVRVEYTGGDVNWEGFSGWVQFYRRADEAAWLETENHMGLFLYTGPEWHFWKASGP